MGVISKIAGFPRAFVDDLRMSRTQALIFLCGWWCWTIASMHFYLLPYTQPDVAKALGIPQSGVAYANTTSMLSRAIGAAIFGIFSDQYGRKIPITITLVLMGVFTLCTGFVETYGQLVGVRFLYGRPRELAVDFSGGNHSRIIRQVLPMADSMGLTWPPF
jgi:MFS transporter, SHS family, lactate transporter